MCFSADASFTMAAATGLVGLVAAARIATLRQVPLGSIPFVFAAQQAIEGGLWLTLDHVWPASLKPVLANGFAGIALIGWPLLAPFALLLVEESRPRRAMMAGLLVIGAGIAAYSVRDIFNHPYVAQAVGNSLCYVNNSPFPPVLFASYALATCGPALISSHRWLRAFGALVVCGALLSAAFYFVAFLSVWCFFAAAASAIVGVHFTYGARQDIHSTVSVA